MTHPSQKEAPFSHPRIQRTKAEQEEWMNRVHLLLLFHRIISPVIISQKLNEDFKPGEAKDLISQ